MCAYVCRTQREDVFVRVAEWTFVVFSHLGSLFFSCVALLVCSPIEPLRLQLESQSDFVSTTVHVLPVNQTWEGELHSCRDTCWIMYHQQCSRSLDCCYIKQCEKKKQTISLPGLRVCVYPTPTRQALSTLVCEEKLKKNFTNMWDHQRSQDETFCTLFHFYTLKYVNIEPRLKNTRIPF